MLTVQDAQVRYRLSGGIGRRARHLVALEGVDLQVERGTALGVVGESGCGKSTLAKAICGLVPLSNGTISLDGAPLTVRRDRSAQRRVQMVFQDPTASLNPRLRIGSVLAELMGVHELYEGAAATRRAADLMELVGLPASALDKRPREFSGGQRQRIGIARALCLEPDVLIADEAVSALDMSTQAVIIDLLDRLGSELDLTMVFISHDLGVVRAVCESVAVMYLGRVVEQGPSEAIFSDPQHPYTQMLLASVPHLDPRESGTVAAIGEPPSPLDPPHGCSFHPRCPVAIARCASEVPPLLTDGERQVACHVVNRSLGCEDSTGRAEDAGRSA